MTARLREFREALRRHDHCDERERVVEVAREWLGTPFHHEARVRGAGVDCCQLLIAVYSELELIEAVQLQPYALNWFLHTDEELVLPWIRRFCLRVATPKLGDVALFGMGRSKAAHGGIVASFGEFPQILHADPRFGVRIDEFGNNPGVMARFAGYWSLRRWH